MLAVLSKHFPHPDCREGTDGGGWKLVRHVPPGNRWHKASDHLAGTAVYGDPTGGATSSEEWSIKFDSIPFDKFLFITGDCQKWLVTTKSAAIGEYYGEGTQGAMRTILKSSKSAIPYKALWFNRVNAVEDPWLSLSDHYGAIGAGEILYGGNHWVGSNAQNVLPYHNGANVYIRASIALGKCI